MDRSTSALVSVRGEGRRTVAPDSAALSGALTVIRDTKAEALRSASAELKLLTDDLASLGGMPQTADEPRLPLGWSAYSAGTEPEHEQNNQTGRYGPTGRVIASVSVLLTVRAFDLLDRLSAALSTHPAFHVRHVAWDVDPDNPSWPGVRAAAVQDAISKGQHYAEALGGTLDRMEHIADVGLLDGAEAGPVRRSPVARFAAAGESEAPSLDPVPQELVAIVEARFVATVAAL